MDDLESLLYSRDFDEAYKEFELDMMAVEQRYPKKFTVNLKEWDKERKNAARRLISKMVAKKLQEMGVIPRQ